MSVVEWPRRILPATSWLSVAATLMAEDRSRWAKVPVVKATTFDELFEKPKPPLGGYPPHDAEFPVEGKSIKSTLFSVSDCQAIVKKLS